MLLLLLFSRLWVPSTTAQRPQDGLHPAMTAPEAGRGLLTQQASIT